MNELACKMFTTLPASELRKFHDLREWLLSNAENKAAS